jgi:hypothetical protein
MIQDQPAARARRSASLLPDVDAFDTNEVRWFGTGPLPGSFVEWFTQHGRTGVVELRSDQYDPTSGVELGIKRRDGGPLEIKHLTDSSPAFRVDGSLTGTLEGWRKVTKRSSMPADREVASDWIEVDKVVVTRRYRLVGPDRVEEVADVEPGWSGCDVELASVTVGGHQSWTYAFEAYGPAGRRIEVIRASAVAITAGVSYPPGFVSRLTLSLGYPAWLSHVER